MSIKCSLKKIRYEKRSASTKVVRNGEQEFLDAHTANSYNNSILAGVAELADAADLKSCANSSGSGISYKTVFIYHLVFLSFIANYQW